MLDRLLSMVPHEVVKIALVFALAFFIGLEREEHKQRGSEYAFGGVRTYPLIGLLSYSLAQLSEGEPWAWTAGLLVVGGLMALSFYHKLGQGPAGLTSEMSGLAVYVIGGLVDRQLYWIATTLAVLSVLLLELKKGLESLTSRVASNEIATVGKFLVLAAVILPVVPNQEFTQFHLNPFSTWLIVVAVSGMSFASYLLQKLLQDRGGVMLSAVLGGVYSSTFTTVVLARRANSFGHPNVLAGSILTASSVMYLRLCVLLAFFNRPLARTLAPAFLGLSALGAIVGAFIYLRNDADGAARAEQNREVRNPLELRAAFLFALLFVFVMVATQLTREYLGRAGLYGLAALIGVGDVDSFILGLTQTSPAQLSLHAASIAILIAAASNNLAKAVYAYVFADRATGLRSLLLLVGLAQLGTLPIVWLR